MCRNSAGLSLFSVMTVLSFDNDFAGHPRPIVIGATQWVAALTRHEEDILLLTGLDENFRAIGVHGRRIANLRALEKPRRRELMILLAVILQMETIRRPGTERQSVRLESILGGDHRDGLRLRPVGRRHRRQSSDPEGNGGHGSQHRHARPFPVSRNRSATATCIAMPSARADSLTRIRGE